MRLSDPFAPSYYVDSAERAGGLTRAPLRGEHEADVTVVGGGIAGCSAALHLAQRGYRVALVEAREIGYGASGRSGGQTIFGLATSQQSLVAQVGRYDARRLFELSVEGLGLLQSLIREHRIDCDYRPNHVHVAVKPRQVGELAAWERELRVEYGYDSVVLLDRDQLRAHVTSDRYLAGLLDPRSGHLHPLKYTRGLSIAAESAGARIFENTQVLRYTAGAQPRVECAAGVLRSKHLIFCGGAYLGAVAPAIARRILGVGTYIVATEPLAPERARALLPSDAAVADINWILDYFRLSADHRLLFGGRVSYSAIEPRRLAASLRQRLLQVFPSLGDVAIERAWGGYLDITMSRAPNFGRLADNVYYLQGFSGHGLVLTALGGKLVAEAVAGTAERFDMFTRIPHRDFPGGALMRRPALMLAMLYYRLRDLF